MQLALLLATFVGQSPTVEFYHADWCSPCQRMKPVIAELEKQGVTVKRIDCTRSAPRGITILPTTIVRANGRWTKITGLTSQGYLESLLARGPPSATLGKEPTSFAEVRRVLRILNPKRSEVFVDFGSGDGRFVIEAARRYGCRAIGVEIDADQAERSRRNAKRQGVDHLVRIITGNALTTEIKADVGVAYLYPDVVQRLRPQLVKLSRFATPHHSVQGLRMIKVGHSFFWWRPKREPVRKPAVQRQRVAYYGGRAYTGRVCNSPTCSMCREIARQLR